MIRPRSAKLSAAAALLIAAASSAHAQVLYSNFGPADSYSPSPGPTATFAGYGLSAARFVPAAGGEFDRVETPIGRAGGFPVTASVSITTEVPQVNGPAGNAPSLIPVWCCTAATGPIDTRSIITFSGPKATLVAGQAYWIVLSATDTTFWYQTSPPSFGATASKTSSPGWFVTSSMIQPAFRVSNSGASPGLGACCNTFNGACISTEPAACTTLGLSFAGVGITCAAAPCAACAGDFNRAGGVTLQDLFDYLAAWFAGCP